MGCIERVLDCIDGVYDSKLEDPVKDLDNGRGECWSLLQLAVRQLGFTVAASSSVVASSPIATYSAGLASPLAESSVAQSTTADSSWGHKIL